MKIRKVVVVYKKSLLEVYARERKDPRLLRLLREKHFVARRFVRSDRAHTQTLSRLREIFRRRGIRAKFVYRAHAFSERDADLVLSVGGDGTFLEASHSVEKCPILGLNSNPDDSVGFFCGTMIDRFEEMLDAIEEGRLKQTVMARLSVRMGKTLLPRPVLNDILIAHSDPAATSRYLITLRGRQEEHKSSGIWVAPAAGATGAIGAAGGKLLPIRSRQFQYRVRELYRQPGRDLRLEGGLLRQGESLVVHSKMRAGRLCLDGAHITHLFPLGERLEITIDAVPLVVYGFNEARRKKLWG